MLSPTQPNPSGHWPSHFGDQWSKRNKKRKCMRREGVTFSHRRCRGEGKMHFPPSSVKVHFVMVSNFPVPALRTQYNQPFNSERRKHFFLSYPIALSACGPLAAFHLLFISSPSYFIYTLSALSPSRATSCDAVHWLSLSHLSPNIYPCGTVALCRLPYE